MSDTLSDYLITRANLVTKSLENRLVINRTESPALGRLRAAMAHGALGGGKRLRPFLVLEAASIFGADDEAALPAATAIEMVHCYSLIHDDLPAMDDADTRRGRPSVHKAYDEAIAILAGDGLLTDAFALLTEEGTYTAPTACRLVRELALAAGSGGMVGGQMMDLYPDGGDEAAIVGIQRRKTGALIEAAAVMGAIVGAAAPSDEAALRQYAAAVGEAFQVVDDILDETASSAELGKPAGVDGAAGKATFVSLLGLAGARDRVSALTAAALAALAGLGPRADRLRAVAGQLASRST
ncbi:putative geranyltranstransferase (farnesyl-diphosphate synthase) [Parvularcula bermudensis HTCC2503]|uniref:Putative geranyltranstransferase (Farnesyl-diphosphate synthase) n=1 Tax=Parvularcula bermudensis (strain ATCC BAA-594 / HTCC2503 / KCTC 12087) TaxID=314260 RepID=E0TG79_PARBH|nr:farnesyl diphosphate synthase [Parvularcula bermudensis]ADM10650.1 putative geranyltranstransferase (farnesyl-diphosphate synthase) [Parvularcula bermudensis HTCC2503]